MKKGEKFHRRANNIYERLRQGHGEEHGKIPTGNKKKFCTDWPIQSDNKKKKLTAGKEERITIQSTLITTWDQRYILTSVPPPLSRWIKNTRDGPGRPTQASSRLRGMIITLPTPKLVPLGILRKETCFPSHIIHAMKQQLPNWDFQLTIIKKVCLFSSETHYSSTSTKSVVLPFLTTKNDSVGINKLIVPGPCERHICSNFYLVWFVFASSSEDLPVPWKSTNANRFYSRVLKFLPLWFKHLMSSCS